MNLEAILQLLKSRWWVLLSLPLIASLIALMIDKSEEPIYSASAKLLIDYRMPLEGELAGEILPVGLQESYVATQLEIIRSRRVAEKVFEKLNLSSDPQWRRDFEAVREPGQSFSSWAVDSLLVGLGVTIGKDSRLVNVWYSDSDRRFAARAANAFVDAYRDTNKELGHNPANESAEAVESLLDDLRGKLERAERNLSNYQQLTGIIDTNEELDVENRHLRELAQQRLVAEAKEREAESRLAALDRMMSSGGTPESLPQLLPSDFIQQMQIDIMRKEAELAESSMTLGKRNPELRRLEAEVVSMRERLQEEAAKVVDGFRQELLEARELAEGARRIEAAQKERVLDLKNARDGLQPLLREVESARASYDRSLRMYSEYAMHGSLNRTNVAILDSAVTPLLASSPHTIKVVGSALLGGLVLAIGLVFGWEVVDRRVRSHVDIPNLHGGSYLGKLPSA